MWGLGMEEKIDVLIGQVKAGTGAIVLQTKAIGSCIAIVAGVENGTIGFLWLLRL